MPLTDLALLTMAGEGSDTVGLLAPAGTFLGVMTGPLIVNPPVTDADLTIPAPADHPTQAITTWSLPFWVDADRVGVRSPVKEFRPADEDAAIAITGFYLADALTGGNILYYEFFGETYTLADENYAFAFSVVITWDRNGRWSAGEVVGDAA